MLKYIYNLSIRIIKKVSQSFSSFYFSIVEKNTVLKEIRKLKSNKVVQGTDIHIKILKDNVGFFAEYTYLQYNEAVRSSNIPNCLKFASIAATFKQGSRN